MIQLKELPPTTPYSGSRPSSEQDQRYDEEAAYESIAHGIELDRGDIIQPGSTERFYRGFVRRVSCVSCLFWVVLARSLLPYVVLLPMMTQLKL
ncbi:hypothetical protein BDV29DRAFT_154196 [Aspergillus leporis]|uniref:Uncharacterized protein n=1 Tax=Aspergillus leporis TaxID=41062 RepID=A0A5N5X9Z7_9EURO|nr:hypothetical protein BDV29DRAFT_154196 [Aspergillus leporis]